ncbi:cell envelope integrity protein CreD [Hydrogenophaga sp. PAMC20947]|uniref:cell envelope integrity protein CreD n=1 Tax=Hydrogenophaga sp. PAMC20947 TaxID=2565558 RepID=UPI00109DB811|nr:cell envelope integrity protein CreD [Hydrogenophaga sp. PAMC20947]QCB45971.1 cell envelope integrity protein CreD [Hydrogenophaga sp. PAMC20947]
MNKYPLLSKTLVIGFLMMLLTIPLMLVRDVIEERSANRRFAAAEVARASAGEQTVVGPVLMVPFIETFPVTVAVAGSKGQTRVEMRQSARTAVVFSDQLNLQSQLDTEVRWRGIFPVTVFNSVHQGKGRFTWEAPKPERKDGQIKLGEPLVLMGVSDARGLLSAPQITLGELNLAFAQAPAGAQAPLPLAATLPVSALQAGAKLDFDLKLELAGTGRMGWVPLADENTVSLKSPWPHPSFAGSFLPRTREVSDAGFSATWSVPALSSQAQAQFLKGLGQSSSDTAHNDSGRSGYGDAGGVSSGNNRYGDLEQFSVSLDDPVDVYRLTERATKYGMMFIVLTFAAFFVLEMVKRWRIHPMQYLMIGAALVLFFLLLLSLSEHLSFAAAYALASAGCITLLSHYLRHVLGSWRAGLGMSGMLVALYGVLYGILISEDNALMMGSLLLFGVLAAIMVATRKLDWYGVMGAGDKPLPGGNAMPLAPTATLA